MQMTYTSGRYIFHCLVSQRNIPMGVGFQWDEKTREYFTYRPELADRLRQFADDDCLSALGLDLSEARLNLADSRADSADWSPPVPEGRKLLPFQKAGVLAICRRLGIEVKQ